MSRMVKLKIDGKEANVPEGTNLIDAAETVNIHIPNLCYLKGMKGIGACRMCFVAIEGSKAPVTACTTKVKEGMNVTTTTDEILEQRKFVTDLIVSMHPLDCMTCTKAGVCNLQDYAYQFEIKESTFTRKKFGFAIDEANPFIKRDPDYCVLCASCVRVCKEQGTNVLDFMGRGVGSKVTTANDKPLQDSGCTFCGSCVDVCPVNAILEAGRWRGGREWDYERTHSTCLLCGNGCDITVSTREGMIMKIHAGGDPASVTTWICAIGRFGFDSATSDSRITVPLKKEGAGFKEITWDEALKIAADKLKKAGANAGIISAANILNEDAFALSGFASEVLNTRNVDTTVSLYADAESMKYSDTADMDSADLIILAGLSPSQWGRTLPALDASIRKRVARGAKLIVINSSEINIRGAAAINIIEDEAAAFAQIAKSLVAKGCKADKNLESALSGVNTTEALEKAAEFFTGASSTLIFTSPSLFNAARNLSLLTKVKIVAVPLEANARGVVAMGLAGDGRSYNDIISGGVDVLYAIGELPLNNRPKTNFLIVQSSYMTELAKQADLILPAAAYLESEGTILNYLGKIKKVKKAVEPFGESRQHKDIIIELSKAIGKPLKETDADIKAAFEVTAKPVFSPFKKKEGLDINPSEFIEAINHSVIHYSRLLWLKEAAAAV